LGLLKWRELVGYHFLILLVLAQVPDLQVHHPPQAFVPQCATLALLFHRKLSPGLLLFPSALVLALLEMWAEEVLQTVHALAGGPVAVVQPLLQQMSWPASPCQAHA